MSVAWLLHYSTDDIPTKVNLVSEMHAAPHTEVITLQYTNVHGLTADRIYF